MYGVHIVPKVEPPNITKKPLFIPLKYSQNTIRKSLFFSINL